MDMATWPLRDTTSDSIARALCEDHGDTLKYVADWDTWLVWEGTHWVRDRAASEVYDRYHATIEGLVKQAGTPGSELSKTLVKYHGQRYRMQVLADAKCMKQFAITSDMLDTHAHLVNCSNGTVDLRTKRLLPHDSKQYLTLLNPIRYDPAALCPNFDKFLQDCTVNDPQMSEYLQCAAGYSLTGEAIEEKMFFLIGHGANGKSLLLSMLEHIMRPYAATTPDNLLTPEGGGSNFHVALLKGARIAIVSEVNARKTLSEDDVKRMTSTDRLVAEEKYKAPYYFYPSHTLWLSGNNKVNVLGTDDGIWRRIILIPFENKVPAHLMDRRLGAKLREEEEGILRWAVDGAHKWYTAGALPFCRRIVDASNGFRHGSDVLGAFIEECLESTETASAYVGAPEAYAAYKAWAQDTGHLKLSRNKFYDRMAEREYPRKRVDNTWRIEGLTLTRIGRAYSEGGQIVRNVNPNVEQF